MKTLYLTCLSSTLLLLFFYQTSLSQLVNTKHIGYYKWDQSIVIQQCDETGKTTDSNGTALPTTTSKQGQYFYVIGQKKNSKELVIQVLNYLRKDWTKRDSWKAEYVPGSNFYRYNFNGTEDEYDALPDYNKQSNNYGENQKYFAVDSTFLLSHSTRISRLGTSLALGVINFPFKLRLGENSKDFSGSFNFGVGIGLRFGAKDFRKFRYSLLSGYSIANVVLDASAVTKNASELDSTNNFTAFSFSLGFMVEYEKVQAGMFIGWDRISAVNNERFGWKYQAKPWISVGFGYAIFARDNEVKGRPPVGGN